MDKMVETGQRPVSETNIFSMVGDRLLKWIDAYSKAPGFTRSCWVGADKELVCMTLRDDDEEEEEEEEEIDEWDDYP